ncbi:MAG: hypothetical protein KGS72_19785 [Cyanobacteria bacterium REEB67]|nr:hypothetical protein [Cyanobacteria bacterium REEB67]
MFCQPENTHLTRSSHNKALALPLAVLTLFASAAPVLAVDSPSTLSLPTRSPVEQGALDLAAKNKGTLSLTGRDIAEQIGVVSLINEIIDTKAQLRENPSLALKHLELKQKLLQQILIASLMVRDTTARIDREIADMNRQSGVLQDKRDRAIKTNSVANIFGAGAINEIGQAGEMKSNEIPGEIVELVGGGMIMALGGLSLYQQSGSKQPMHARPNMLAEVLNCPTDRETLYPAIVWNYLNRAPAGAGSIKTRLELLVEQWQKYGTIGPLKNAKNRKRFGALSNTMQSGRLTLDLLGDRMDMLADVKAEVFQLDRDLLELLLNVQNL